MDVSIRGSHLRAKKTNYNSINNISTNRITAKASKQNWEEKTILWIFQATNWQNLTPKDGDMATKGKP